MKMRKKLKKMKVRKNIPLNIAEGYKIADIEFLVSQLKEGQEGDFFV